MGKLLLAEPLGLHRVVAVRQQRISGPHARDQRVDDRRLDPVRKVAAVGDVLEVAPAVGNLLVLRERVRDQREERQIGLEDLAQRLGGRLALLLVGIRKEIQRRLERQRFLLAFDVELQGRHRLVEKPGPGGAAGLRLFP